MIEIGKRVTSHPRVFLANVARVKPMNLNVLVGDGEGSKLMPLIEQDEWCIFWADGNSVISE
ncbi:hypothetical protein MHB43_32435 [Paenibacillus sp. FSL H8-0317]|uniref:hypothetical protein n=1 Tax=Paenibacillus sp. FSL H8-0317 TaxID=2921385 RepID=UPI00324DEE52